MATKIMAGNRKGLQAIKDLSALKKSEEEPDFPAEPPSLNIQIYLSALKKCKVVTYILSITDTDPATSAAS